jgi:uncharacterized protein (TIGR02678 family)
MTPAEITAEERCRAVRALLMRPLLLAGRDDDTLMLVRRHAEWLATFFRDELGWTLHHGTEIVRLAKTPGRVDDPRRGLRDRRGEPFTRRRYVLLALAMAALARADRQTTLHQVAEDVVLLSNGDEALGEASFHFALETQADRRDLVAAIAWLLDHGVLQNVDGQEEGFVRHREKDALYRVDHEALSRIPTWRVPPSLVHATEDEARLWALLGEPAEAEASEAQRRHRIARRVVDDPVVYYDDLDEAHARYLMAVRGTILRRLAEALGLELESRREGVALVDAACQLTDRALPEEGTEGHVTLLLAEFLATHAEASVEREALCAYLAECREAHGAYWRADAREPGNEMTFVARALERLFALDLAREDEAGRVVPMPAVARYALMTPELVAAEQPRQGRLDV